MNGMDIYFELRYQQEVYSVKRIRPKTFLQSRAIHIRQTRTQGIYEYIQMNEFHRRDISVEEITDHVLRTAKLRN